MFAPADSARRIRFAGRSACFFVLGSGGDCIFQGCDGSSLTKRRGSRRDCPKIERFDAVAVRRHVALDFAYYW